MDMLKSEKGFTLIEMLIVLLIIAVLIILIVPNLSGRTKEVHDKGCDALKTVVQSQVHLYHLEKGEYPENLGQMVDEKYITEEQLKCSNNKKLVYVNGVVSNPND